ncbi:MAG: hypothetical protein Q8K99_12880 [Actinomycetota bacterium]|nr:hypothetical protein [Actinomycetota bacterium]
MLKRLPILVVLAAACALLGAAPLASPVPLKTDMFTYEVQIIPEAEETTSVVIVSLALPPETPLPATVRLPIPKGGTIYWSGEILGDDFGGDIGRQFRRVPGEGGDSAEITLEETRTAQIDATYKQLDVRGGEYSLVLDWVQTEPCKDVSFSVRIPGSVTGLTLEPDAPGSPLTNVMGERLYTLAPVALKPGEEFPVKVTYSRPELARSTSPATIILWVISGLLIIAVGALAVVVARQHRGNDA